MIRILACQYNYSTSLKDLSPVAELVHESVPLLTPTEDGDVVALTNGLFDLRTRALYLSSPEVVLISTTAVEFRSGATTCPVIDGWNADIWIRELANDDPEIKHLFWHDIAALFRTGHLSNKTSPYTHQPAPTAKALSSSSCATSSAVSGR